MSEVRVNSGEPTVVQRHARWVRISHWIVTASVATLAFTGLVILMAHPRLYWGEVGNDLTPAWLELPISRNHQHQGWDTPRPFFANAASPVSASRTFDIFNQNGWGRSLHFLAAWCLVWPGIVYMLAGLSGGHFRAHLWPGAGELAPRLVWRDVVNHLRLRIPPASGGPTLRLASEMRVLVCRLRGGPRDRADRLGHVARDHCRVAGSVASVWRLSIRPHHPLLHLRCAAAVRDRPRCDGREIRIQTSDPGHDHRRLT